MRNLSKIQLLSAISNFNPYLNPEDPKRVVVYRRVEITLRPNGKNRTFVEVAGSPETRFTPKNNPGARIQTVRDIDTLIDWMDESPLNR